MKPRPLSMAGRRRLKIAKCYTGQWGSRQPPKVTRCFGRKRPEDLQQFIQSGQLNVGDTVMTPRGPRVLTEGVIRKLMSASGDSAQQQTDPVKVQSQDELRAKIQSGEIPIGGKYVVNGLVFTRSR